MFHTKTKTDAIFPTVMTVRLRKILKEFKAKTNQPNKQKNWAGVRGLIGSQRLVESQFEVSQGKKFTRPHVNQ
jgi:hypothetical protein